MGVGCSHLLQRDAGSGISEGPRKREGGIEDGGGGGGVLGVPRGRLDCFSRPLCSLDIFDQVSENFFEGKIYSREGTTARL